LSTTGFDLATLTKQPSCRSKGRDRARSDSMGVSPNAAHNKYLSVGVIYRPARMEFLPIFFSVSWVPFGVRSTISLFCASDGGRLTRLPAGRLAACRSPLIGI